MTGPLRHMSIGQTDSLGRRPLLFLAPGACDNQPYPLSTPWDPPHAEAATLKTGRKDQSVSTERPRNRSALEVAAWRLVSIVESADDAIVSKDLAGTILSWNRGAERLFGYAGHEVVGRPITIIVPQDRLNEEKDILERLGRGERIEDFETLRRRKDGSFVEISLTVSPVRDDEGRIIGASKIARDISQRKRTEEQLRKQTQRLEILNHISKTISQDLDLERIVQAVTDIGTELSGAKVGAFLYNVIDQGSETHVRYALSGAAREPSDKLGLLRNAPAFDKGFPSAEIVRCDDIGSDPRYGTLLTQYGILPGLLPVVSYLVVPVIARTGNVVGSLFFGHDQPGIFRQDERELIAGIAAHAAIAMENARLHQAAQQEVEQRRRAEETSALLLNEIKHRVKNTLAIIQAIAVRTFRKAPAEERESFIARLHALASTHDLLSEEQWDRAAVAVIVRRALTPFQDRARQRFRLEGPETRINADKALLLAMALHELATNAVKYGSLSTQTGGVSIRWETMDGPQGPQLKLQWWESGGPPVAPPTRKGFGTGLIERAFNHQGGAQFEFRPDGIVCALQLNL
jgi:PAS domain S-box-containing protein